MSRWKQISSLVHKNSLVTSTRTSYTFTPNKEEVIESRFRLRYSNTCNSYYRDWFDAIDPSSQGVITGWDKALYAVDSVRRHINEDVGQVCLERVPGSSTGFIKWRMNFGCSGLLVDDVTLRLSCMADYGGEIIVTLIGSPGHKRVRYAAGSDYVTYTELENSPELTLIVHFVGEAGQVTQLFPQNILRGMGYPLDIRVILKPPLQSLGWPRILVGLMYNSSQEIEVDSRHYKQNTSHQAGQGFLHIHLFRGRDLPQEKHSAPETFSKCYLLPDPKKTTKCRTKSRKGKDPVWNEQFLVVGINYHEIKRRALEICIADSNTSIGKKAKFIGGVRLSLGYKAVVSAQTKQVNQVLRFLKSKGGVSGALAHGKDEKGEGRDEQRKVSSCDNDPVIGNVNMGTLKWKETIRGTNGKQDEQVDGEAATSNKTTANGTKEGGTLPTVADDAKTNEIENEPQEPSSSSSTEEPTEALLSSPDSNLNLDLELEVSRETHGNDLETFDSENAQAQISSPNTIQITNETLEASWESVSTVKGSNNDSSVQQLFQSVLSSIKQLEFVSLLSTEGDEAEESDWLSSNGKADDGNQVKPSDDDNDFEETEGVLLNPGGCQQENDNDDCTKSSRRLSSRIPKNVSEKEEKDMEIETLTTSEPAVITKVDDITKAEKEGIKLPILSEHSRGENVQRSDQQNGSEAFSKSESSSPEKTTRKDLLLNHVLNKRLEQKETLQGNNAFKSEPASQHGDNNVGGLRSESTVTSTEAREASTDTNEMKRSPSFTLRDLGKKLNLRRRSRSGDEAEKASETNLETGANKMLLDAQGLEITQWRLMVERPRQWHYCWHILRSEMNILH